MRDRIPLLDTLIVALADEFVLAGSGMAHQHRTDRRPPCSKLSCACCNAFSIHLRSFMLNPLPCAFSLFTLLGGRESAAFENRGLDLRQTILAEEHLVADQRRSVSRTARAPPIFPCSP